MWNALFLLAKFSTSEFMPLSPWKSVAESDARVFAAVALESSSPTAFFCWFFPEPAAAHFGRVVEVEDAVSGDTSDLRNSA